MLYIDKSIFLFHKQLQASTTEDGTHDQKKLNKVVTLHFIGACRYFNKGLACYRHILLMLEKYVPNFPFITGRATLSRKLKEVLEFKSSLEKAYKSMLSAFNKSKLHIEKAVDTSKEFEKHHVPISDFMDFIIYQDLMQMEVQIYLVNSAVHKKDQRYTLLKPDDNEEMVEKEISK